MSTNETVVPGLKYVTNIQLDINVAFSVLITIVTIPSNFLLVLIFYRFKKLRDLNNTAITMLSLTDFLRGCIVMTMKIHNQSTRADELGYFVCHLTALMCAFSFVFSPLMLALISFVRYCRIVPHTSKRWNLTDRNFYIISAVLFFVASLFSILPYIGIGEYGYSQSHGVCFADWRDVNKAYRTIFYTLVIGIAFPVLTISYATLYVALRKHNKKMTRQMSCANSREVSSTDNVSTDTRLEVTNQGTNVDTVISNDNTSTPEQRRPTKRTSNDRLKEGMVAVIFETENESPNQSPQTKDKVSTISKLILPVSKNFARKRKETDFKKHVSRQEYRVTKLLILIFIAYIICWFPAALVNVISLMHWHTIPEIWYYIIVTLVELKSALDPVIYGLGNKKYRKCFRRMVKQLKNFISNNIIARIRWFTNI